jgi:hypothetical protein
MAVTFEARRKQDGIRQIQDMAKLLSPNGYTCYAVPGEDYAFLFTPAGNVLAVNHKYFGGWNFSFEYVPSKKNGTGCQCYAKSVLVLDLETVQTAERLGEAFANRLEAIRYKSPQDWMNKHWEKDRLVLIK